MKNLILAMTLVATSALGSAGAQIDVRPLPKPALMARTVAIVNNTRNDAVEEGASETLKRWGRFTIVDDRDLADIVLTFDKKSEHEGTSTQKTDDDGKVNNGYSMSFSSSIHMKASLKGAASSFYSTSSGDSKMKAGSGCVLDLQRAYLSGAH